MVKDHGSTFRDEWAFEEREFLEKNEHADEIKMIFELAKVEYGRIDYALLNGKLQVWEINTNPTIGRPPDRGEVPKTLEHIRQLQEPAKKVFFERFQAMLESIDSPHTPEATVELILPEKELDIWRVENRAIQRIRKRRGTLGKLATWPPAKRLRDIAKNVLGVP